MVAAPKGGLAWLILKRQNPLAASVGLLWITVELILTTVRDWPSFNVILSVLLILSINGVRGTFAARSRTRQIPTQD